jgi:hypothetical protein
LAIVLALIAASLLAFVAYAILGPFDSDPDNGPVIPAVVLQEVTPTPTPIGEHKLTIDLPADRVHSTGSISAGWDYIEFPQGIPYPYEGYCCPGPFIEYVLTGELTVQSDVPMTTSSAASGVEIIDWNVRFQVIADMMGYIASPAAVCIACEARSPGARNTRYGTPLSASLFDTYPPSPIPIAVRNRIGERNDEMIDARKVRR